VVDFARRLEKRLRPQVATLFPYEQAEDIWNEHRESTRGRDLDITGLSYARLDDAPAQWPFPQGASEGRVRLYEDGVFPTADGRARFADTPHVPLAEPRDARYPFSLNTGRLRDHWHGMSRTGTLGRLFGHVPEPAVEMNAQDLARLKLQDGDLVHITSRRGSLVLPVQASTQVPPTQAFIAMHWGEEFVSGSTATGERVAGVNALTSPAFCPTSKQPELKHAAVKVLKAELPWRLLGVAWLPQDGALRAREALRELMSAFPYAVCVPFGRERSGLLFRAAAYEAASAALVAQIETLLGLGGAEVLHYVDKRRGQRRSMKLVTHGGESRLEGFVLAGDTSAEAWIKTLLQEELPAQSYGRMLLVPGAKAPVALAAPRGRQVCSCFNVGEAAIDATLRRCSGPAESRLQQLQDALKCGTNCGSCVPELKRMVRLQLQAA
jgi:assimilatory nitrate reductase catalytic subunit